MPDKLKPCPFCGGEAKLRTVNGFREIRCNDCYAYINRLKREAVINAWNRRDEVGA